MIFKTLDPELDPDPHGPKMLDPDPELDPDPHRPKILNTNANPQHCFVTMPLAFYRAATWFLKFFFQMSLKVKLRLYPAIFSWERIASTLHTLKYFYATYVIGLFLLGESLAK